MANAPGTGDFESLARQYWQSWGDAMRQGAVPSSAYGGPAMPGWQEAVDWWSQLARGGTTQADDVVGRFNAQARDWFGAMQQLAARFGGQEAGAADIAAEWKRALGAIGENPFPEMFKAMRGQGAHGLEQWTEAASPWLDNMRREGASWLGMPAFGLGREQQERMQALMQAQADFQQREAAYNALMMKALQHAHELFADKLIEHEEPGRQLTSARALFDLWIDAAEQAYAEIALSPEFRKVYGAMVNAQMRLRQGVQRQVEQAGAMLGMPTRTEVDSAHRKIAELERALRRVRDAVQVAERTGKRKSEKASPRRAAAASPNKPASPAKTRARPKKGKKPGKSAGSTKAPAAKRPSKPTQSAVKRATTKPAAKKGKR